MRRIYISCPVSIPLNYLEKVRNRLDSLCPMDLTHFWDRSSVYSNFSAHVLDIAEIFILVLPNNRFNINRGHLPVGCRNELDKAIHSKKKIFIAYENGQREINFYKAVVDTTTIAGVAGTTADIIVQDKTTKEIVSDTMELNNPCGEIHIQKKTEDTYTKCINKLVSNRKKLLIKR